MKRLSLDEFAEIVRQALETLPDELRPYLKYVAVDVEEKPSRRLLRQQGFSDEEIADGETLFGLFWPLDPHAGTGGVDPSELPSRIIIFKQPHEDEFPDPEQMSIEIRKTVIHELAHHFGYTDKELERFDNTPNPFDRRKEP